MTLKIVKAETLFMKLLSPLLPDVKFTAYQTPADLKAPKLVVVSAISLSDVDPEAAQHWSVTFNVRAKDFSEALDIAVRIYQQVYMFSDEGVGIPDVGYVGHIARSRKPSRSSGQDAVTSFDLTTQL